MLLMEFMLILDEQREAFIPELKNGDPYSFSDDTMHRMIMVTDYIKNNLTADDLSEAAMAEKAGISRDYFSKVFRNVTGTNYSKWLNIHEIRHLSCKTVSMFPVDVCKGLIGQYGNDILLMGISSKSVKNGRNSIVRKKNGPG